VRCTRCKRGQPARWLVLRHAPECSSRQHPSRHRALSCCLCCIRCLQCLAWREFFWGGVTATCGVPGQAYTASKQGLRQTYLDPASRGSLIPSQRAAHGLLMAHADAQLATDTGTLHRVGSVVCSQLTTIRPVVKTFISLATTHLGSRWGTLSQQPLIHSPGQTVQQQPGRALSSEALTWLSAQNAKTTL
jgi:hypothetical protein